MTSEIRIAIVDDHNLVRTSLARFINQDVPNFKVSFEASNGREFISTLKQISKIEHPHIVLLDINMPIMNGFETARWLRYNFPEIKVVALSLNNDETTIIRMINQGVAGYLLKNIDGEDLKSALETVAKGGIYFKGGQAIGEDVPTPKEDPIFNIWYALDIREKEFVRWCCTDIEDRQISEKMNTRLSAVESLRKKIFSKFQVNSRISLVILMYKNRILDIYDPPV